MSYPFTLTLQDVAEVTHDVRRFRFDRPEGFDYEAGQATHMALDREGWRDEDRPFTMASLPDEGAHLDFVIKIYPDHDGVTKELGRLAPGARVLATEPAGAITDHGAGTFLAAGAGITPFIPILDSLAREDRIAGSTLVFANKSERDIILRDHWTALGGLETVFVTDTPGDGFPDGPVDAGMLARVVQRDRPVYICGPHGFVDAMKAALDEIGVAQENRVVEDGW
ncbi:MAG: FAD-binding oxidoreductase [Roseicyclus sp.]